MVKYSAFMIPFAGSSVALVEVLDAGFEVEVEELVFTVTTEDET